VVGVSTVHCVIARLLPESDNKIYLVRGLSKHLAAGPR
jgi:hypothetical protein